MRQFAIVRIVGGRHGSERVGNWFGRLGCDGERQAHLGLPVVAASAEALSESVPLDAGVLVPVDDADALAHALRKLIERPQERERLAAGARAATFPSWREQGARFARVLEALA